MNIRFTWRRRILPLSFLLILIAGILSACAGSKTSTNAGASAEIPEFALLTYTRRNQTTATDTFHIGEHIRFEHLSLEPEVLRTSIYAITQDHYGFIWIGTMDGLYRYDGNEYVIYKYNSQDPDSLSSNMVWDVMEDHLGNLWVATENGLNRFDRASGNFIHYYNDPMDPDSVSSNRVSIIYEDTYYNLWIGTHGGGLNLYDSLNERFVHYRAGTERETDLSNDNISAILMDSLGLLWIGTWDGLDCLNLDTKALDHYNNDSHTPYTLSDNQVRALAEDQDGTLWVGTASGLNRYDRRFDLFRNYTTDPDQPYSISDNAIWDLMVDSYGVLWVATGNGLNQYLPRTEEFYHYGFTLDDPESLSSPQVYSLFQDQSGAYWVGTAVGKIDLFSNTNQQFTHYQHEPGISYSLSYNMVYSFARDTFGLLWVGTEYGLNVYDRMQGSFSVYLNDPDDPYSLSDNTVRAALVDREGNLWIGTARGLNEYDRDQNRFSRFRPNPEDPSQIINLDHQSINALAQDQDGSMWLGTNGNGLIHFDPGTDTITKYVNSGTENTLRSNVILSLLADSQGTLWVGTLNGGLSRYVPETGFITYLHDSENILSISDNTITSIYEDRDGILWLGTTMGLNRLDPRTGLFTSYRERSDGVSVDMVYGVQQDSLGFIWFSSNIGLMRLDPLTGVIRSYTVDDGLQSNEFNPGAAYQDAEGALYFGGNNGFNVFTPEEITENSYVPPIVLTSLSQGGTALYPGRPVEEIKEITLQWPRTDFDFEYTALNFIQREQNQYAYRLEGLEENWNQVGNRRYGRYTNLTGGTYTLRIIGSNNDGVWNQEGIVLRVNVIPPFWETSQFQWGAAILLAGVLFLGYRIRVRSVEYNNRILAEQVKERTREIEQRREVAERLRDVLSLLNSNRPLEESLSLIITQVAGLLDARRVFLLRLRGEIPPEVVSSFPTRATLPASAMNWLSTIISGPQTKIIPFSDMPGSPYLGNIHMIVGTPILLAGETYGGLAVFFENERTFTDEELDLLNSFADQAALAIGNARLRARAEEMAVHAERSRLARDLHDAVTQTLFSASLIAEALPSLWENDPREGRQLLRDLRQLNRGALAEMRSLLMELRPAAVAEARLPDLLHQLAETVVGRTGVEVDMDLDFDIRLPADVHIGLYRIAQEALTNVVKHAHATTIVVRLHADEMEYPTDFFHVLLEVCDNGVGFIPTKISSDHFGLENLRERAQAMDAKLELISEPGKGTIIRTIWEGKAAEHDGKK